MDLRFFEIYRSAEYLELLALGVFNSVILTTFAGIIGFSVGVFLAVIRYERVLVLGFLCASYTDFVRNTPLIVQMFFVIAHPNNFFDNKFMIRYLVFQLSGEIIIIQIHEPVFF